MSMKCSHLWAKYPSWAMYKSARLSWEPAPLLKGAPDPASSWCTPASNATDQSSADDVEATPIARGTQSTNTQGLAARGEPAPDALADGTDDGHRRVAPLSRITSRPGRPRAGSPQGDAPYSAHNQRRHSPR